MPPSAPASKSCPTSLSRGEDYILYSILDFIVDNYAPVMEAIQREVDALEDGLLDKTLPEPAVDRLYTLRRELLKLRKAVAPLVDVCHRLEHADETLIEPQMQPFFRDVSDHIRRVQEDIDALREVLAFAFEASLMAGQAQQNAITRKLAAWAAILAVPTAVAGIYGMNFQNMPELNWRYGYYAVIAVILGLCGWLYWRFKRVWLALGATLPVSDGILGVRVEDAGHLGEKRRHGGCLQAVDSLEAEVVAAASQFAQRAGV